MADILITTLPADRPGEQDVYIVSSGEGDSLTLGRSKLVELVLIAQRVLDRTVGASVNEIERELADAEHMLAVLAEATPTNELAKQAIACDKRYHEGKRDAYRTVLLRD